MMTKCSRCGKEYDIDKEPLRELCKRYLMCEECLFFVANTYFPKEDNQNKVWMMSPQSYRSVILDNLTVGGEPLSEADKDEMVEEARKRQSEHMKDMLLVKKAEEEKDV